MGRWREAFNRGRHSRWDLEYGLVHEFGPPATEEQLAWLESQLGFRLPLEVRDLLTEFNGIWETSRSPEILYLDTVTMATDLQHYLRYGGDPPITRRGTDLRKVAFVAQVNGFADVYGVCVEPVAGFPVGAVVRLDHETGELEAGFPTLLDLVEEFLK